MQNHAIDSIIKEINIALAQLPSDKKAFYCARMAFSILKAALEETKELRATRISSADFGKFVLELQQQPQPKAILSSFTIIFQIVNFKLIHNSKDFQDVLEYLKFARSIQDDDPFQLKLCQLALALVNTEFLELHCPMYIERCLFMLLFMRDSRNPIISSLANSHLSNIMDNTCANIETAKTTMEPNVLRNVQIVTVSKFLVDLIFVIDGQRSSWYPPTSSVDRELGLRWVNSLLKNAKDLAFTVKDNVTVLMFNLLPVCKKVLNQYQPPVVPSFIVEIFRTFIRIVEGDIPEAMQLFDLYIKYIRHSDNSICKNLSLESVVYFTRSQYILKQLTQSKDFSDHKNPFVLLLLSITEVSKLLEPTQIEMNNVTSSLMIKHLEGDVTGELAIPNQAQIMRLIADFQNLHAATLYSYLQDLKASHLKHGTGKESYRRFIRVVEHTARITLAGLGALLSKDINECLIEICLQAMIKMIYLLGEVFNKQIQIDYINVLAELATASRENSRLTLKQLLALKFILKLLQNVNQQVDFQGWSILLTALNTAHKYLLQSKVVRQGTQDEVQKMQLLTTVNSMLEDLLVKSHTYPDKMLITMLDGLNQVTFIDLQSQANNNQKVNIQLGITKTLEQNFFRIDVFWELVTAHFLTLANSKFISLRESGAIQLSELIVQAFQHMAQYYKLKPLEEQRKEREALEQKKLIEEQQSRQTEIQHQKEEEDSRPKQKEVETKAADVPVEKPTVPVKQQIQKMEEDVPIVQSVPNKTEWTIDIDFGQLPEDFEDSNQSPFDASNEPTNQVVEKIEDNESKENPSNNEVSELVNENQSENQEKEVPAQTTEAIVEIQEENKEIEVQTQFEEQVQQNPEQMEVVAVETDEQEQKEETEIQEPQVEEQKPNEEQKSELEQENNQDQILQSEEQKLPEEEQKQDSLEQQSEQDQNFGVDEIQQTEQIQAQIPQIKDIELVNSIGQQTEMEQQEESKEQSKDQGLNQELRKQSEEEVQEDSNVEQENETQAFKRSFERFSSQPLPDNKHHLIEKEKWTQESWQETVLQPWVQCLTIRYTETKVIIMNNVSRLLQSNGHQINAQGWESILSILLEVSQEQTSNFAKQGLKSVEHMINLYLSMIDEDKVPQLFDIIENFRRHSEDASVNLEFCDMLWHFGDYLSKRSNQQQKIEYMNKIFAQLCVYSLDSNKEIRNQSLHIICNLLLHNSSSFGCNFWKQIFEQHFFPLMKAIITTQYEKLTQEDSDSQAWQTTCKSLLRNTNKLLRRYMQLIDEELPSYNFEEINNCKSTITEDRFPKLFAVNDLVRVFLRNMSTLLNQLQIQFHLEIVEAIKDLFVLKPFEIQLLQEDFYDNMQYVRMIFTLVPPSLSYAKTLLFNVTPVVLQYITHMIKQYYPWTRIDQKRYIQEILSLYFKVLGYPSLVLQTHPSLRIKQDYTPYIRPIEAFQQLVINHPNLEYILGHLLQTIYGLQPNDIFNDYCIRSTTTKCIQFVVSKGQNRLDLGLRILKNMSQIMEHRWKSNYHRWYYSLKKQQLQGQKERDVPTPIWQFAYETFFELSVQILLQPPYPYQQVFYTLLRNYDILKNTESINLMATYLQDSQMKLFLALEVKSLQFLYKKFVHSPFAIIKVYGSSQPSPSGEKAILQMSKDFAWVLYQLIQPENYYFPTRKVNEDEQQEEPKLVELNVALQSFKYLIELVHFDESSDMASLKTQEQEKQLIWIQYLRDRSRNILPYLLAKVTIIVKQYIKQQFDTDKTRNIPDEFVENIIQLVLQLRIPRQCFIEKVETDHQLNEIHQLRDPNHSDLLNGEYGHLFYLFPLFTRLIEMKTSVGVKQVVKIFLDKIYQRFGFMVL